MRAINLIPAEERRGAGGAAGRSGGAAYVLLGLLALLVIVTAVSAMQRRGLDDKRSELARVETEAAASEGRAGQLASYTRFAALRTQRVTTVTGLAASRFDWSHSLREVARVIPANVWLTSLQGTVTPGVTLKSGAAGASSLRGAIASPAIEIVGCTTDHDSVARMVTRMRLIDGVSRVSLQSSVKGEGAAGGGSGGDCRQGRARFPQFALVIFFDQAVGAVPTGASASVEPIAAAAPGATGPSTPAGPTP